MKLNKSLFAVLAIFLVAISVCAVSAEDGMNDSVNLGDDDAPEVISPAPDENSTDDDAPEVISSLGGDNETDAAGTVDSQSKPISLENYQTGNPILVLMAVLAIIGSVSIKRK